MTDRLLTSTTSLSAATKKLREEHVLEASTHLYSLQCQGILAKSVNESITRKNIALWSSVTAALPAPQFNFVWKAFIQCLPTALNLVRWARATDPLCALCSSKPQTNKHVLSNCRSPTALRRYIIRHNEVLLLVVEWLRQNSTEIKRRICRSRK